MVGRAITEGKVRKGGHNEPPTTPRPEGHPGRERPAPSVQTSDRHGWDILVKLQEWLCMPRVIRNEFQRGCSNEATQTLRAIRVIKEKPDITLDELSLTLWQAEKENE